MSLSWTYIPCILYEMKGQRTTGLKHGTGLQLFLHCPPVLTYHKMQTASNIYLIPKNGIHTEKI